MAKDVAGLVRDYRSSDYEVTAIVGVDGSPSCGIETTLDPGAYLAGVSTGPISVDRQNWAVHQAATLGRGIFIAEIQNHLRRNHLSVPFLAHDLLAELDGKPSNVTLR
jgi:hypothetical protein